MAIMVGKRLGVVIVVTAALAGGCGYSMIEGGQLKPDDYTTLAGATLDTRGGQFPESLEHEVVESAEVPGLLREMFLELYSLEELADYQAGLEAMGIWPAGKDYLDEYLALAETEIAGFYSSHRKKLYVVEDVEVSSFGLTVVSAITRRDLYREFVLSHELIHAIQDEIHGGVMSTMMDLRHHDDVGLALSASIEGDALVYGFVAVFGDAILDDPEAFAAAAEEGMGDAAVEAMLEEHADAPALLVQGLLFPYRHGIGLSVAQRLELLDDPPISTEQVLHPERRQEAFTLVDLRGIESAIPEGCRLLSYNSLGEFGISIVFAESGTAADEAAWSGWDGDGYVAIECDGQREIAWLSWWDSESDANEFAEAYSAAHAVLATREGVVADAEVSIDGRSVLVSSSPDLANALREAPTAKVSSFGEFVAATREAGAAAE